MCQTVKQMGRGNPVRPTAKAGGKTGQLGWGPRHVEVLCELGTGHRADVMLTTESRGGRPD